MRCLLLLTPSRAMRSERWTLLSRAGCGNAELDCFPLVLRQGNASEGSCETDAVVREDACLHRGVLVHDPPGLLEAGVPSAIAQTIGITPEVASAVLPDDGFRAGLGQAPRLRRLGETTIGADGAQAMGSRPGWTRASRGLISRLRTSATTWTWTSTCGHAACTDTRRDLGSEGRRSGEPKAVRTLPPKGDRRETDRSPRRDAGPHAPACDVRLAVTTGADGAGEEFGSTTPNTLRR